MLVLELSSYVLEFSNDPVKIWLAVQPSVRVLQADWLILENHKMATSNINMPYYYCNIKFIRHWGCRCRFPQPMTLIEILILKFAS